MTSRIARLFRAPTVPVSAHAFFRSGVALTFGTVALHGGNWLYHVLMSRYLAPSGYGELAALLGLLLLLTFPTTMIQTGLSAVVAGEPSTDELLYRPSPWLPVRWALLWSAAALAILMLLSPWITRTLRLSSPLAVAVTAMSVVVWILLAMSRGVLLGGDGSKIVGWGFALEGVLKLGGGLLLVVWGFGVLGAVAGVALGSMAALALMIPPALRAWRRTGAPWGAASLRPLVPYAPALLALTVLAHGDVVIVKAFSSSEGAGIYAAASTGGKVLLYATAPFVMGAVPQLCRYPDDARLLSRAAALTLLAAGLPILLIYVAWPTQVIRLLFGSAFTRAVPALAILGLAMLTLQFAYLGVWYRKSLGRTPPTPYVLLPVLFFPVLLWVLPQRVEFIASATAAVAVCSAGLVWLGPNAARGLQMPEVVRTGAVPSVRR